MAYNGFVEATNSNGDTQRIPEHWLDHPELSKGFKVSKNATKTATNPDTTASDATTPSETWTKTQMTDYAAQNGIDIGDATLKADIYSAITSPSV